MRRLPDPAPSVRTFGLKAYLEAVAQTGGSTGFVVALSARGLSLHTRSGAVLDVQPRTYAGALEIADTAADLAATEREARTRAA